MKLSKWMTMVAAAAFLFAGAAEAKGKTKLQITGQVNLNTGTLTQLDALPGVGEKAAKRILEHRQKQPFSRTEELAKVKGFGKKKFEKLKAYLTVSGPTTIQSKRISVASDKGASGKEAQGRSGNAQKR